MNEEHDNNSVPLDLSSLARRTEELANDAQAMLVAYGNKSPNLASLDGDGGSSFFKAATALNRVQRAVLEIQAKLRTASFEEPPYTEAQKEKLFTRIETTAVAIEHRLYRLLSETNA